MLVHVLTLKADDDNSLKLIQVLLTHHVVPSVHGRVVLSDKIRRDKGRVFIRIRTLT